MTIKHIDEYAYEINGAYANGDKYHDKAECIYGLNLLIGEIVNANDEHIENSDSPLPHSIHITNFKHSIRKG